MTHRGVVLRCAPRRTTLSPSSARGCRRSCSRCSSGPSRPIDGLRPASSPAHSISMPSRGHSRSWTRPLGGYPSTGAERSPYIPWEDVIGMRSKLIHEYFRVKLDVVWGVVRNDLPPLIEQLEARACPRRSHDKCPSAPRRRDASTAQNAGIISCRPPRGPAFQVGGRPGTLEQAEEGVERRGTRATRPSGSGGRRRLG